MEDEIRNRHTMKLLATAGKPSITNYTYNPTDFTLPTYLQVPLDLSIAHTHLHESAYAAIRGMKEIMHFHDHRFSFLCPQTPPTTWTTHCKSMQRLRDWKQDTFPPPSAANPFPAKDPTLAPRPKLPCDAIRIRLDAKYYAHFVSSYVRFLDEFFHGVWTVYMKAKCAVQGLAARCLSEFVYREWRYWWDGEFRNNMRRWEDCCAVLPLPMWEDVVDEVYLMVVDRVEEPGEIAAELCRTWIGGGGWDGLSRRGGGGEGGGSASVALRGDVVWDDVVEINVNLGADNAGLTRGEEGEEIQVCLDVESIDFARGLN